MSIVTIDLETFYDKDYSLSKMTTEEYINDPRFEVIGMGIKYGDRVTEWFVGGTEAFDDAMDELRVVASDCAIVCHNTLFDGAILAWKYGITPGFWLDTLSMARALRGIEVGGSLKALASHYQIGEKGDEVINALGKCHSDFSAEELERYGAYCRNDVDLTYRLLSCLAPFPDDELRLIDLTLRMFMQPVFEVDDALLVDRLEEVKREKSELLAALMGKLNCATEEDVRAQLASNLKFAEVLRAWGVEPPTKISPVTGKEAFAFAKTDEGFITLTEHEDPFIQQLCAVRLGTKSTIEESRVERFIGIGKRNRGLLPIPLRYYGAHTGRWAGSDSVNFQNLPSRDKKKKALKNSVLAPRGQIVINCDSSQIEARVLAWLAEQDDVTEQFARGEDVYSTFATKVFGRTISKADPVERFVGKTCVLGLGYGTGAKKLQHTLKTQPPGADLSEGECKRIVSVYRDANFSITSLWKECDLALQQMMEGGKHDFSLGHAALRVHTHEQGILLPNGLYIRYNGLRYNNEGKMIYNSRRGPVSIWGGGMVENVVQALARIIVGHQMTQIADAGYRPALTVHDSVVCVVPENELEVAVNSITQLMSTAPDWAKGLPVACETKYGQSYGDC